MITQNKKIYLKNSPKSFREPQIVQKEECNIGHEKLKFNDIKKTIDIQILEKINKIASNRYQ